VTVGSRQAGGYPGGFNKNTYPSADYSLQHAEEPNFAHGSNPDDEMMKERLLAVKAPSARHPPRLCSHNISENEYFPDCVFTSDFHAK
jgi:hypothetical protein